MFGRKKEKIENIEPNLNPNLISNSSFQSGGLLDDLRNKFSSGDNHKIELTNKLVDTLIDDIHPEILDLKTTVISDKDIATWQLTLELLDTFMVDEFVLDKEKRNRLKFLKRKIYNSRVGKDGRGRSDILQSLSNFVVSLTADELKEKFPFRKF